MKIRFQSKSSFSRLIVVTTIVWAMSVLPSTVLADQTIGKLLSMQSKTESDYSKDIGEKCHFTGWDKHHTDYTVDSTKTVENKIEFLDARPLLLSGVNLDRLPRSPGELGRMSPGQWYFLSVGEVDPHHGCTLDIPLMLRASKVKGQKRVGSTFVEEERPTHSLQ